MILASKLPDQAPSSTPTIEEVDGGWQHTTQDHHQHGEVLVYSLKQPVKSQRDEDHDGPGEQVAGDAETEERLVRGDVVGRRGRVAMHEQLTGYIDEGGAAKRSRYRNPATLPGLLVELMCPPCEGLA